MLKRQPKESARQRTCKRVFILITISIHLVVPQIASSSFARIASRTDEGVIPNPVRVNNYLKVSSIFVVSGFTKVLKNNNHVFVTAYFFKLVRNYFGGDILHFLRALKP